MKKLLFVGLSVVISACSTAAQKQSLEGVWVWENIDQVSAEPILEKHILVLAKESYEESFFENDKAKGSDSGVLFVNQTGSNVEFSTTGNIQKVYKGEIANNRLMIISLNDKPLSPPALYIRQ